MREQLGKYVSRRKVNLVVKIFLDPIGEGPREEKEKKQ